MIPENNPAAAEVASTAKDSVRSGLSVMSSTTPSAIAVLELTAGKTMAEGSAPRIALFATAPSGAMITTANIDTCIHPCRKTEDAAAR
jgi:hypothetical protein